MLTGLLVFILMFIWFAVWVTETDEKKQFWHFVVFAILILYFLANG